MDYHVDSRFDPRPLAIEVKALVSALNKRPQFKWMTVAVSAIESVAPMTDDVDGSVLRLRNGDVYLLSNSYSDVSEALIGDAKRFAESTAAEAAIIESVEAEEDEAEAGEEWDGPPSAFAFLDQDDDLDDLDVEGGDA
jgi:hypothetical protein